MGVEAYINMNMLTWAVDGLVMIWMCYGYIFHRYLKSHRE